MPFTRRTTGNVCVTEYTVAGLAGAYEDAPAPHNERVKDKIRTGKLSRSDWYGGIKSVDEARALLEGGWAAGGDRLGNTVRTFGDLPTVKSRRRRPIRAAVGDEFDEDKALRGDWDQAWRATRREWCEGTTTVDLFTLYGGSAALSAEQIFWVGAAACVLTDLLEGAGYRVRLVGSFLHSGTVMGRHDVIVKDHTEALRIDAVASILCHAGVYRTFLFRSWLQNDVKLREGLGPAAYVWAPSMVERMKAAGEWPESALIVNAVYNESDMRAEVSRVLGIVNKT